MVWWEAVLLFLGGGAAGIVNAMAGGGSSLTVPLYPATDMFIELVIFVALM